MPRSFTQEEVEALVTVMDIPENVYADNGVTEPRVTAMAMLLRRLAYPTRLTDIELEYGWEKTRFSRITHTLATYIYQRWKHLLRFDSRRLTPAKLKEYANAVTAKGAPTTNVWGFIDGTLRKTARPVRNQRIVYNGWKRIHALKWHSIITPDGIHAHVFGPIEGGDAMMRLCTAQAALRTSLKSTRMIPTAIHSQSTVIPRMDSVGTSCHHMKALE